MFKVCFWAVYFCNLVLLYFCVIVTQTQTKTQNNKISSNDAANTNNNYSLKSQNVVKLYAILGRWAHTYVPR